MVGWNKTKVRHPLPSQLVYAQSFISNNIPAITFTTGTHNDYHKLSDDAEKINYEGMKIIFNFTNSLLFNLQEHEKRGRK
ncbi:MAG: M28 family peptidase [Bacteroidia bacterium]|nr:M28 family peptidase [Bacteroidia bacterium]